MNFPDVSALCCNLPAGSSASALRSVVEVLSLRRQTSMRTGYAVVKLRDGTYAFVQGERVFSSIHLTSSNRTYFAKTLETLVTLPLRAVMQDLVDLPTCSLELRTEFLASDTIKKTEDWQFFANNKSVRAPTSNTAAPLDMKSVALGAFVGGVLGGLVERFLATPKANPVQKWSPPTRTRSAIPKRKTKKRK